MSAPTISHTALQPSAIVERTDSELVTRVYKTEHDAVPWDRFLQTVPGADFFALYGWLSSYAPVGFEPEVLVLLRDGNIVGGASYASFDVPYLGARFVILPHGPIPFCPDDTVWADVMSALDQRFRERGVAFVQVFPHEPRHSDVLVRRFEQHGFVSRAFFASARFSTTRVAVPIRGKSDDELLTAFHPKTRANVRKSLRRGLEWRIVEDEAGFNEDYNFLSQQAAKQGWSVRPQVCLKAAFDALLRSRSTAILEVRWQGALIGSMFMVFAGGVAAGYYSATNRDYRKLFPAEFLQWNAMKLGRERGQYWYDFVNLGPPGVERFKRGFGPEVTYWQEPMTKVYKGLTSRAWRLTEQLLGATLVRLKRQWAARRV